MILDLRSLFRSPLDRRLYCRPLTRAQLNKSLQHTLISHTHTHTHTHNLASGLPSLRNPLLSGSLSDSTGTPLLPLLCSISLSLPQLWHGYTKFLPALSLPQYLLPPALPPPVCSNFAYSGTLPLQGESFPEMQKTRDSQPDEGFTPTFGGFDFAKMLQKVDKM